VAGRAGAAAGAPLSEAPTGRLRLRAARLGDRTVLAEVERTAPFHITAPSDRAGDGRAEVVLQHVGPGLFPGDDLLLEATVEAGADLTLRGQAATKLYPCPPGARARVRTRLRVEPGGCLVFLPGELIPFRDAAYRQETEVALAEGARCALAEIVTPGRVAMGERDAFACLDLRLRLAVAGRPVLVERARLEPAGRPLGLPGRHGPYPCAGALYLAGYGAPDLGHGPPGGPVWWGSGATAAGDVTLVRLLGPTAQALQAEIARLLREAAPRGPAPTG
jgi:urease accessory protein